MPPEVQQILTDQEYQAPFFSGCGTKPLPGFEATANLTQQIHDRIHESQKWEAEFLEASDQKHAVGDGQL